MKSWTTSNSNKTSDERWDEKVKLGSLHRKYKSMRPIGGFWPYAQHWFEVYSKKREGFVKFPLVCGRFDPENETFDPDRTCAACDAVNSGVESLKPQIVNAANFIDRDLQEGGDPNPIVVLRLGYAQTQDIEGIVEMLKRDPADPTRGIDLAMKYDDSKSGKDRYSVQRADDSKLTTAEKKYELYPLDELIQPASSSKIQDAVNRVLNSGKAAAETDSPTPKRTRRASPPKQPRVYTSKDDGEEIGDIYIPDEDDGEGDGLPF